MRTQVALPVALLLTTPMLAQAQDQTVTVGPWTIATSSKAEKFDSCTMSRSTSDLDVTFVRGHDGLLLRLDSSKWKLERGKAYSTACPTKNLNDIGFPLMLADFYQGAAVASSSALLSSGEVEAAVVGGDTRRGPQPEIHVTESGRLAGVWRLG